jgi:hypothetical protein
MLASFIPANMLNQKQLDPGIPHDSISPENALVCDCDRSSEIKVMSIDTRWDAPFGRPAERPEQWARRFRAVSS